MFWTGAGKDTFPGVERVLNHIDQNFGIWVDTSPHDLAALFWVKIKYCQYKLTLKKIKKMKKEIFKEK